MTKNASFKKIVRRHAEETGQRYTGALTDLEGLGARLHHEPAAERLVVHLRERYGVVPVAATKLSVHKTYVFRIDLEDGGCWVARAFPPARPRVGVEGDAAILRFLEREGYPAERVAVEDPVSDFVGSAVLVSRFVEGAQLPDRPEKFAMMDGLPQALLRGNLLHAPEHAILTDQGPVAINWKASGRGPRLADFAYLIWGTGAWNPRRPDQERIDAAVNAYRRHIEPTDDELERLEAVMYIRTLYLTCFGYRRAITDGVAFREWWFIRPRDCHQGKVNGVLMRHPPRAGARISAGRTKPGSVAGCECRAGEFRSESTNSRSGSRAAVAPWATMREPVSWLGLGAVSRRRGSSWRSRIRRR